MTSAESKLLDVLHAARYPTASSLPWHIEKYGLLERIMELFAEEETEGAASGQMELMP